MDFAELRDFITSRMRMSHVYQPVMIKTLLLAGGKASVTQLATAQLVLDRSQIEYYEVITKQMVGPVLTQREIVSRDKGAYSLNLDRPLTPEQTAELIGLCDERIAEYIARRGDAIWNHRRQNQDPVPGSLRYRVLRQAKGKCECCGTPADLRAIDVDHIKPRSQGGTNDIANLQALCYSCNRAKRDRDDTDFRAIKEPTPPEYGCPFCHPDSDRIITQSSDVYAMYDLYPVAPLHTLVIPTRHERSFFELSLWERNCCMNMVQSIREYLQRLDPSIKAFNVGFNDGKEAGQTVFHCHIHVIPRRPGDVKDPRGGVRHTIPGKGYYSPE